MDELERLKASRDANLSLYSEYNKTLRSWFVAFGIAVPAVFITSKDAKEFLLKSQEFKVILVVFLCGVASQVAISIANKFIAWSAYHRDDCKLIMNAECHMIFRCLASLEDAIWIDFIFDVATVGFFLWAVIKLFAIA